jgi:hypothetical protein
MYAWSVRFQRLGHDGPSPLSPVGRGVLFAALLAGCSSSSSGPDGAAGAAGAAAGFSDAYPSAPAGSTAKVLYVSAKYTAGGSDGSAAHPFAAIGPAIAAANGPTVVLVAPGTYAESLEITKSDLGVYGSSDPKSQAGIILQAPEGTAAIRITGASNVTVQSVSISKPTIAGIWVNGGQTTTLSGIVVDGSHGLAAQPFGYGVVATNAAGIILQHSKITGSSQVGVMVTGASGIILQSEIGGNALGGVRIQDGVGGSRVEGCQLVANTVMGIGVFGSQAIILQNGVSGTIASKADPATGLEDGIADGVIVSEGLMGSPANVEVKQNNLIHDNGRAGVLVDGNAMGIILQNDIGGNRHTGIYLQSGAGGPTGVQVTSNILMGNHVGGIGVTTNAAGIILQNTVGGTLAEPLFTGLDMPVIGDGIGVYAKASATIEGNTVTGSGRFGVIFDGASGATTALKANVVSGSAKSEIILQNPGAAAPSIDSSLMSAVTTVAATDKAYPTDSKPFGRAPASAPPSKLAGTR